MIKYEDECVGCPPEMGCLGSSCPYRMVKRVYCDKCGDELDSDDMYRVDGEDLCEYCLQDMFRFKPEDEDYD